jgi:hypothetical protein
MPDDTPTTSPAAGDSVSFGVDTVTFGVAQSVTINGSAEIAEARDENGAVICQKAYSKTMEATVECLCAAGSTPPNPGTSATIGSVTGLVTASSITKSNTEFTKISITVQIKDSATQVPLGSGTSGS